jgi:hypothetical protein
MTTVLLWMTRLDALKWRCVVTANVGGQTAVLKKPFKHGKSEVFSGGGKRFAAEQVTAGMVGDGEA